MSVKDRSQNKDVGSHFGVTEPSKTRMANSPFGVTEPGQNYAGGSQFGVTELMNNQPAESRESDQAVSEPLEVVVSLFPGADIFGRGFEDEGGFCVVRGPDPLWGGDIRDFQVPVGFCDGIIGGPPCQDFSGLRRDEPTGYGMEMIREFTRIVRKARPMWWLMENVAGVPDVKIDGYNWQRLDVRASEFGLSNRRLRHFQWGSCEGDELVLPRVDNGKRGPIALASNSGPDWSVFLSQQGLPADFDLPGMTWAGKKRAVGNGVAYPVARALARAVKGRVPAGSVRLCKCGCGRPVTGRQKCAGAGCRKRLSLRRRAQRV